jgi:FkbM family methyltransferase
VTTGRPGDWKKTPRRAASKLLDQIRTKLGIPEILDDLRRIEGRIDQRIEEQRQERNEDLPWPGGGAVYFGEHTALSGTRWGGMLLLDTRDGVVTPDLALHGIYEREVTQWLLGALSPGQVFLDVGANIGYFSVLAARKVGPGGHVYSVEPHPRMAEILRRNAWINGYGEIITLWRKAAWSEPRTLTFNLRVNYAANSSAGAMSADALEHLQDEQESIDVEAVTLDELLDQVPHIDVMKIDVEGSEVQAFRGMTKTLDRNPGIKIMFEWSQGQIDLVGDRPTELLDLLQSRGYGFRQLDVTMASVTAEELIKLPYANVLATPS